ncbi:hypothetical protein KC19_12G107600 [Ceratodon purpureus]|uniref:Uncharacterized protein n=1 Tax=Ceratodon purpureus TaxID=3225 RepID=A0A8T0G6I3_CERPU|nr:hypothetical protein KC19_12G107600 [Ceratodon purpureus]
MRRFEHVYKLLQGLMCVILAIIWIVKRKTIVVNAITTKPFKEAGECKLETFTFNIKSSLLLQEHIDNFRIY